MKAAEECSSDQQYEEGGIIFEKDGVFKFQKIENIHDGTPRGISLYEVHTPSYGKLVSEQVMDGWKLFASFHTHPSFSAQPSMIDLDFLFKGYKYNVIYSNLTDSFAFCVWLDDSCYTFFMKKHLIHKNEIQ
jgi:proteasome lid subunit RPN8/RPN11